MLWKKQALGKIDKSNIGGIDKKIQKLCNMINKRDDMFTLSSCSGRICLLKRENNSKTKLKNIWIYLTHEIAKFKDLNKSILDYNEKGTLEFRQESIIIHICVLNNDIARELMRIGQQSGFNHCGIISNKRKIVVELVCDISINCPIYFEKLLISDEYLKYLIKQSNFNLKEGWSRAKKLEKEIKGLKINF